MPPSVEYVNVRTAVGELGDETSSAIAMSSVDTPAGVTTVHAGGGATTSKGCVAHGGTGGEMPSATVARTIIPGDTPPAPAPSAAESHTNEAGPVGTALAGFASGEV